MLLSGINHVAVLTQDTERFHAFYRDCQVVGAEGKGVERSRLGLSRLAQQTIAASLGLLGISAPEKM